MAAAAAAAAPFMCCRAENNSVASCFDRIMFLNSFYILFL